ncbi:MAG TPA: PAS domain-containing protein, partial [Mesotoga sp.]|nr:PAS domain-containing protein [Mesotoga sp.]
AYRPMPVEFSLSESKMEASSREGLLNLGSGYLTFEQLRAMMSSLPFDITFVDGDDTVRFFSEGPDRIFVRTRAVIGRKVQNCHPQKSVNVVNKILADFKAGQRDVADFWLNLGPKMVYIKYIALRDSQKRYIGTLEVTQDIAPLRELEGEKRIYDAL